MVLLLCGDVIVRSGRHAESCLTTGFIMDVLPMGGLLFAMLLEM